MATATRRSVSLNLEVPYASISMMAHAHQALSLSEHLRHAHYSVEFPSSRATKDLNGKHSTCSWLNYVEVRLNLRALPCRIVYNSGLNVMNVLTKIFTKNPVY